VKLITSQHNAATGMSIGFLKVIIQNSPKKYVHTLTDCLCIVFEVELICHYNM
jgi:hypothetical protein